MKSLTESEIKTAFEFATKAIKNAPSAMADIAKELKADEDEQELEAAVDLVRSGFVCALYRCNMVATCRFSRNCPSASPHTAEEHHFCSCPLLAVSDMCGVCGFRKR